MSEAAALDEPITKKCSICNFVKDISQFHKNGTQPSGKVKYKPNCKSCTNMKDHIQYYARLTEAIRKGGRDWVCEICGYDKNLSGIAFHHIDPSTKEFEISKRRHATVETFMGELDKCAILCQNCHAEEHNPQLSKKTVFEQCEIEL